MSSHNRSQVLEALCRRAEACFEVKGVPFVTVTYAQSLDGSIAGLHGEQLDISCQESLVYTHALRACHDGILVGIDTVLSDDPLLSTRLVQGDDPRPIVLDSNLRIPGDAQVLSNITAVRPIVCTTSASNAKKRDELRERDVCVVELPADANGWINLGHLLPRLGSMGIKSLMVEGGSKVITSFLQSKRVDHLIVTLSMKMIGGTPVLNSARALKSANPAFPFELNLSCVHWEGTDMILHGDPVWQT